MDQDKNAQGQPDWNKKKPQQPPDRSGDQPSPNRDSGQPSGIGKHGEKNVGDDSRQSER